MLRYSLLLACLLSTGCSFLPEIAYQPTIHNPFPQLSKVAVAPFFNHSNEPTLDTEKVALAYYAELQSVPGFEVVPVSTVEAAMRSSRISLNSPADARRLAQLLGVDAVVVGAVTDYTPYYPPRCALKVEWYAANPCFHPIPPGYGLPWGTPGEEEIPAPLVFEAEFALAKAQLETQTPPYLKTLPPDLGPPDPGPPGPGPSADTPDNADGQGDSSNKTPTPWPETQWGEGVKPLSHVAASRTSGDASADAPADAPPTAPSAAAESMALASNPAEGVACAGTPGVGLPPNWPDPRGFIPPPPRPSPPVCEPTDQPVISHTKLYDGNDSEFTEALASYCFFRDDARFGGWQSYLQRSDDFVRFCCRMHIAETLSARGGAGETRVVWRWPTVR